MLREEIDAEEISELVDKREQILLSLIQYAAGHPEFARSEACQKAVSKTQQLVGLMESKTEMLSQTLRKYRHGKQSLRQYKKFL